MTTEVSVPEARGCPRWQTLDAMAPVPCLGWDRIYLPPEKVPWKMEPFCPLSREVLCGLPRPVQHLPHSPGLLCLGGPQWAPR